MYYSKATLKCAISFKQKVCACAPSMTGAAYTRLGVRGMAKGALRMHFA